MNFDELHAYCKKHKLTISGNMLFSNTEFAGTWEFKDITRPDGELNVNLLNKFNHVDTDRLAIKTDSLISDLKRKSDNRRYFGNNVSETRNVYRKRR